MANLDDFFAKKDKKKKKGFSRANADVLAKNLHEHELREAKAAALEEKNAAIASYEATKAAIDSVTERPGDSKEAKAADDEWLNYEEEEKDYTGLKIEALKIGDDANAADAGESAEPKDENDDDDDENDDDDEDSDHRGKDAKEAGPWKRGDKAPVEATKPEPAAPSAAVSAPSAERPSGSYVPPGRRFAGAASGPALQPIRMGKRVRAAPNIDSEMNFPSLSASMVANPDAKADEGGAFTEVRFTGSSQSAGASRAASGAPQLETGNKFSALRG